MRPIVIMLVLLSGFFAEARLVIDIPAMALDSKFTIQKRAENLARGAEILLDIDAYLYADQAVDAALDLDPENIRANVIKRYLDIIQPCTELLLAAGDSQRKFSGVLKSQYENALRELKSQPMQERFLTLTDKPEFTSMAEVQRTLRESLSAQTELIHFLRQMENKTVTVHKYDFGRSPVAGSYERESAKPLRFLQT